MLERFIAQQDEAAFELLLWRHGAMVLSVCQRVLSHAQDSEDAFQATFLALARQARSIGRRESVGCWLHRVAQRVALRARYRAARRTWHETQAPSGEASDQPDRWSEIRSLLDEEVDRLPEKYRRPFVLCFLEGKTNEEAAEQLGCPVGTVFSRLARARERLRGRLVGRGVALTAAGLGILSGPAPILAEVPAPLLTRTLQSAALLASKQAVPASLLLPQVATLLEGAAPTAGAGRPKLAVLLLALGAGGAGAAEAGLLWSQGKRPPWGYARRASRQCCRDKFWPNRRA